MLTLEQVNKIKSKYSIQLDTITVRLPQYSSNPIEIFETKNGSVSTRDFITLNDAAHYIAKKTSLNFASVLELLSVFYFFVQLEIKTKDHNETNT